MAKRVPISKRLRFRVLEAYHSTCFWCGSFPPHVVLEIDHLIPVSNGGTNEFENLVPACCDCNRGKGAYFNGRRAERRASDPTSIGQLLCLCGLPSGDVFENMTLVEWCKQGWYGTGYTREALMKGALGAHH